MSEGHAVNKYFMALKKMLSLASLDIIQLILHLLWDPINFVDRIFRKKSEINILLEAECEQIKDRR